MTNQILPLVYDHGLKRLVYQNPTDPGVNIMSLATADVRYGSWYGARDEALTSGEKLDAEAKVQRLVEILVLAAVSANPQDPLEAAVTMLKSVGDAKAVLSKIRGAE